MRKRKTNLLRLAEEGLVDADLQSRLRELGREEGDLAEEVATCQVQTEEGIRLNVALVRSETSRLSYVLDDATPEEIKQFLREWSG